MHENALLHTLMSYDRWATTKIFDACGKLTAEQFQQRFDIGPGSLHDTLTHLVGSTRAWTETLASAEPRPRLEADGHRRTPEQLRALFEEAWQGFTAEAGRRPLDEIVTRRTRDGRTFDLTRGAVVAQVATHGAHHRAQCLNMLRRLGVTPLPPSSVAEWAWMEGTAMRNA